VSELQMTLQVPPRSDERPYSTTWVASPEKGGGTFERWAEGPMPSGRPLDTIATSLSLRGPPFQRFDGESSLSRQPHATEGLPQETCPPLTKRVSEC
jgi:hypothetical protein